MTERGGARPPRGTSPGVGALRPRIGPHRVVEHADGRRVMVAAGDRAATDLRPREEPLCPLCDGTRTVDALLAAALALPEPVPPVDALGFLARLDQAGLLEGEAAGRLVVGPTRRPRVLGWWRWGVSLPWLGGLVGPGRWIPRQAWAGLTVLGVVGVLGVLSAAIALGRLDGLLNPLPRTPDPVGEVALLYAHAAWLLSARGLVRGLAVRSLGHPVHAIELRFLAGLVYLDADVRARSFMPRRERLLVAGVGLAWFGLAASVSGLVHLADPRSGAQPLAVIALMCLLMDLAPYLRGDGWHLVGILSGLTDLRRRTASFLLRRAMLNIVHSSPLRPDERRHLWVACAWLVHGLLTLRVVGAHVLPAGIDLLVQMLSGRGVSLEREPLEALTGILLAVLFAALCVGVLVGLAGVLGALAAPLWRVRQGAGLFHREAVHPERARELEELIPTIPLFGALDASLRRQLLAAMQCEQHGPGARVIRQGDAADRFYYVRRGTARVLVADESGLEEPVARLAPGDFFGEAALCDDEVRSASVEVVDPMELLSLSRAAFQDLVARGGPPGELVGAEIRRAAVLRRHPLFSHLPAPILGELLAGSELATLPAGTEVLRQGEPADALYLIRVGFCSVWREAAPEGAPNRLARLGPGDYFGEIALLSGTARTASVRTETDVELVRVPGTVFARVLLEDVRARLALAEGAERRLGEQRGP